MSKIMTAKEAMAASEKLMEQYRMGEACEGAFLKYRLIPGNRAELADKTVYEYVCSAFYGAESMDQLNSYMLMSPSDIVAMVARQNAAADSAEKRGCDND